MNDTLKLIEAAKKNGNINPASNDSNGNSNNAWTRLLMMSAFQNINPQVVAGAGIGKLLRQLFDNWKERYDDRGVLKGKIQNQNPEEVDKWITEVRAVNPKRADYLEKKRAGWVGRQPQINEDTTRALANEAISQQGLLDGGQVTEAGDKYDFSDLPSYLNQFGAPDLSNGSQYTNNPFDEEKLAYILGRRTGW